MRTAIDRIRRFALSRVVVNVLFVISSLSIFDIILVYLGGSYLSTNTGAFFGKSNTVILSDLLFIEGAIILAIGIFVAVAKAWQETTPTSNSSPMTNVDTEVPRDRQMHPSIVMMMVGAALIALSIAVGTLLQ